MTEDEFRRGRQPAPQVDVRGERSPNTMEERLVALAVSVAACASDARVQMPALPAADVHRCADAALALAHASRLLCDALARAARAADERHRGNPTR